MKILTRYILWEFLKPFVLSLLAFSILILVIQVFNDIRIILENRPGLILALKYFLLQIPELLIRITPIAILMAVLFSLSHLSKNSELIAMRAGGVSVFLVTVPLVFWGFIIFGLSVVLNEAVVPKTAKMVRHTKVVEIQKQAEQAESKFRQNISMIGVENQLYHVGSFDGSTNTMTDVLVLEFTSGNQMKTRLDAKSARFEEGR